jgi:apolipoprotein N-acyltransferase
MIRGRLALPAAALLVVAAYGWQSRVHYAASAGAGTRVVGVVQGNVANAFRWKRAYFEQALATYVGLTRAAAVEVPDLFVWPENAVSFYIDHESGLRDQLGEVARTARAGLLLGSPRLEGGGRAHNSAYLIGGDGQLRGTYDKRRLVPFAEYDLLAPLRRNAAPNPVVWVPGTSAAPLRASASGVSGLVTPLGETYSLLPSGTQGTVVAPVPLRTGQTPYVRWGDSSILLGTLLAVGQMGRSAWRGA